ncbi:hypothetical protein [Pedobacter montanisoli]|uniref:DKNYY family protein n=1 Tax=Pedobacter montanisoli TaxID=2923277 RepID=A0ABS9ZS43_9SPHI|nr:hypothetical protein [Pedobacter montanisoli]MCJ0741385.1 hypothetical protein [Pedobacter montanisoli]
MKTYFKPFLIIIAGFIFSCKQKSLEFIKLDQFTRVDTIKGGSRANLYKEDYFIVNNYKDDLNSERIIDSSMYKSRDKELYKYTEYKIIVYRASEKANIDHLRENPADFDNGDFDNNKVFVYIWRNGTWSGKYKYKNRQSVEAQEMIRED